MGRLPIQPHWMRERWVRIGRTGATMAGVRIEQKALDLLNAFERAGKPVGRVTIEGRKIELVLVRPSEGDDFEGIDMRHGKT